MHPELTANSLDYGLGAGKFKCLVQTSTALGEWRGFPLGATLGGAGMWTMYIVSPCVRLAAGVASLSTVGKSFVICWHMCVCA